MAATVARVERPRSEEWCAQNIARQIASGPWGDPARVERLKQMWADGFSASQIAAELGGVTRNGVIGKAHRLGLAKRVKEEPAQPKPKPERKKTNGAAMQLVVVNEPPSTGPELTELLPEPVQNEGVSFWDVADWQCRFPITGDTKDLSNFRFCGQKTLTGCSWCSSHYDRVFSSYQPRG